MDRRRLKEAKRRFLLRYPAGFLDPELRAIGMKHAVAKRSAFAQEAFAEARFARPQQIVDSAVTLIGHSSVVSLFEKPAFRNHLRALDSDGRQVFADALHALLHGDQAAGFEDLVRLLARGKIAKWPIITALLLYYRPQDEVFIKPTTAKRVIAYFGLTGLDYRPRPDFAFYARYRDCLREIRALLPPELAPDNAALSGFLMMSVPEA
jgi:hypothetical protein